MVFIRYKTHIHSVVVYNQLITWIRPVWAVTWKHELPLIREFLCSSVSIRLMGSIQMLKYVTLGSQLTFSSNIIHNLVLTWWLSDIKKLCIGYRLKEKNDEPHLVRVLYHQNSSVIIRRLKAMFFLFPAVICSLQDYGNPLVTNLDIIIFRRMCSMQEKLFLQ